MNSSYDDLTYIGIALAIPLAVVAILNWSFSRRGGFIRGWAGALFIGICWIAGLLLILERVSIAAISR